jgi:hypothetical protein
MGVVGKLFSAVGNFILWGLDLFYGLWHGWLWQSVKYIGIPLYIFGMLLAIAFSGGYFILLVGGFALYYMYLKKMVNVQPIEVENLEE